MGDDDTPVIRPVLPSRASAPPAETPPRFDLAAQVRTLGADSLLPSKPERTEPVKKSKKDPRRSAAAREAWKKRRKTGARVFTGGPVDHAVHRDELGVLMQISALLEPLPAAKRKAVLTILQGLTS